MSVTELSDFRPHIDTPAYCWRCGHHWHAVYPVKQDATKLACSRCGAQDSTTAAHLQQQLGGKI